MKDKSIAGMVEDSYHGVVNYQINGTNYGPGQGSQAVFHLLLVILGKISVIEQKLNDGKGN